MNMLLEGQTSIEVKSQVCLGIAEKSSSEFDLLYALEK